MSIWLFLLIIIVVIQVRKVLVESKKGGNDKK